MWSLVVTLVSQYGGDAVAVARERALAAMQEDRQPDFQLWEAVSEAATDFLKLAPNRGEWLN
ncbi:MAG: hypothetical protein JWL84_3052 [Rhodospirillales bacterium]|jgi:hypothetical protein|nr:hypothetical protein [Rhodospirillales bacterium]